MVWKLDETEWRIHQPGMFARLPELGIDGKPLRTSPTENRVMRRTINGERQFRSPTTAELEIADEEWARGVF